VNGAKFNNMVTGVLDVQREDTDSSIISGTSSLLDNAGTIVKSAGTVTGIIHPITTNTGTIESRIGLLEFRNLTQTAGEILLPPRYFVWVAWPRLGSLKSSFPAIR
jgi:hypothetical protein